MSEDNYGYFKYSLSGDIFTKNNSWGLGNSVFAAKILYIANILDEVEPNKKEKLKQSILRFTKKDGYIFDSLVSGANFITSIALAFGFENKDFHKVVDTRRAETRQSFAALSLLDAKPKELFTDLPKKEVEIDSFLNSFDWSRPWHAGSHLSHLLFFLKANEKFFGGDKNNKLIKYTADWISKLQSSTDGCWYRSENVSLKEKINGAMKVLTGLHAADIYEIKYTEKLIDTCLIAANDDEACSNFNVVYVLYGATRVNPDYRKAEIEDFLLKRLEIYKKYYYPEIGGFSFYENKSNDIYYGKLITKGLNEPDIHGTIMFVWGISIINQIIDLGLDFKVPFN